MLKFQKNVPIKETYSYLAKFPRFSLIEKISPRFFPTSNEASIAIATIIKEEIIRKNSKGQTCVLGLATGSSPLGVYRQLIRMHRDGELSFKNVVTFNLDEYYPILNNDKESYTYYMNYHLFNHIDIPRENINVPNGEIDRANVTQFCADYQKKIKSFGGIDIQILGIGRTGHIGFNEPPSPIKSITRLVYLHRLTRKDAASSFGGIEKVPKCALTMGIDTIKKAKKIIIMAWSESKAYIVKRSIEGTLSNDIPSTFLHEHSDATFFLDKAAGEHLTRFETPWIIKGDAEDPIVPKTSYWVLNSVTWLSEKLEKPLLRLTYDDYEDHNLAQLVMECAHGSVEDLNLYVYKKIISRITGWPLGSRPQESQQVQMTSIAKKAVKKERVLVFSPHPDDDVISMGGTLKKLQQQGHQVHVAYMVSGANGVPDYQAKKYLYFLKDFSNNYFWKMPKFAQSGKFICEYNRIIEQVEEMYERNLQEKYTNTEFNHVVKKTIRSSQAKVSIGTLGLKASQAYCLDLPFYGSHKKSKNKVSEADYEKIQSLLRLIEPTVIYAAGDLTDPHGTHRQCLELILDLYDIEQQKIKTVSDYKPLFPAADKFFLYRGAWEEWSIAMARVIVPLSPKDVEDKMSSIFKHQSQKDGAMYLGDDKRQFWMRARDRNRNTAQILNKLGFSDYQACECFVNLFDLKNYDEI